MPSPSIVTRLPLERLSDDQGAIEARRERFLSKEMLRELLRRSPVQFVVAEVGRPLNRVDSARCYEFWKSEAEPHIVEKPNSGFRLEDFPGEYAYVASEWLSHSQKPIVLLEKYH